MLGWFADAPAPDAGLLAFHQVSDALGNTPWYLRLLRDDMTVAQRMARLLASSRYAVDLLLRQPETVAILGDDAQLTPRDRAALQAEAAALVGRHAQADDAVAALRALRRRELLRTAMADLLGRSGAEQTGEALTTVTAVTVDAPRCRWRCGPSRTAGERCPPGCAWWRWAGSAGTSPATAATPT